jgi:hypothetical protein
MIIKSIRIKNLQKLVVVLQESSKKKFIDKLKTPVKKKNIKMPGEVIVCDDKYIQKIIRNGGL